MYTVVRAFMNDSLTLHCCCHFRSRKECVCKQPLTNSTTLPCEHEVCRQCWLDIVDRQRICPECRKPFPEDWKFEARLSTNPKEEKFMLFRKRCNAFMMAVVSRLVFGGPGQEAPADDVVCHLMGYVLATAQPSDGDDMDGVAAGRTREFGFLRAGLLDTNPVFRSFLLQQLLRSTEAETAAKHLTLWLNQSRDLLPEHGDQVNLAVVVVQCFEDVVFSRRSAVWKWDKNIRCEDALRSMRKFVEQLDEADKAGRRTEFLQELHSFELLESIASLRVGLALIADIFVDFLTRQHRPNFFKEIFRMCKEICRRFQWPRYYLIRQLCRRYGTDIMSNIQRHTEMAPLFSAELCEEHQENLVDVFVTYGEPYCVVRRTVMEYMLGDEACLSSSQRQKLGEAAAAPHAVALALLMYLYQMRNLREDCSLIARKWQHIRDTAEIVLSSEEHDGSCAVTGLRLLCTQLEEPLLSCVGLEALSGCAPVAHGVRLLYLHWRLVLECSDGHVALLAPMLELARDPASMAKCFLPGMPQDELFAMRKNLRESRVAGDNLTLYCEY